MRQVVEVKWEWLGLRSEVYHLAYRMGVREVHGMEASFGNWDWASTSTGQDFRRERDVLFVSSDQYISSKSWMRNRACGAILASDLPATRHALRKTFAHIRNAGRSRNLVSFLKCSRFDFCVICLLRFVSSPALQDCNAVQFLVFHTPVYAITSSSRPGWNACCIFWIYIIPAVASHGNGKLFRTQNNQAQKSLKFSRSLCWAVEERHG
jgi:hypothetical protein